jgi:hypothetical protein
MQLVAYGAQDVYLTGNPQITFFKVVYRRHTNFSCETIEQAVDSAKPGGRYTVTVHRNGDLATNSAFKVKVPAILGSELPADGQIAWVRRLGHALCKNVEVEIGGSKIDKQAGTFLDIWYELTHTEGQERGYRKLIGDVPEMTALRDTVGSGSTEVLPEYTLYVPFQFWFCRNTGLALPLIALQYHEVRFHIELESITKLLNWNGATAPPLSNFSFRSASVMVDYVYLDSEERRRFAQVGHEYLIEQVQHTSESLGSSSSSSSSINSKFKLNFNHPCKELIWATKVGAFSGEAVANSFTGSNTFLAYTHRDGEDAWQTAVDNAVKGLVESMVVNGSAASGASQVDIVDTSGQDTNGSVDALEASGGGAKVEVTVLGGNGDPTAAYLQTLELLGNSTFDFGEHISAAHLNVTVDGSGDVTAVECTSVTHTVTLRDLSIPVADWTVDNRGTLGDNNKAHHVIQHHNYGLRLDGAGNPTKDASLELNGHPRFSTQEGSYFNYWQTRAHTRTPADGVNVYCFGLHPENHQPSGTANLSRIDSTLLCVTFSDSLRPRSNTAIPTLDWTTDTKVHIFALSYNVLRIMSGMGGLAYSN